MSGTVNKVILIGNLGADPEVRHLDNNLVVASFPLATSESYTDKNTGEKISHTDWHNITVWRGLAEVASKYLSKGQKVFIEGKLRNRSWKDKEGNTRYTTEIVADELVMLSSADTQRRKESTTPNYSQQGTPNPPSDVQDKKIDSNTEDDLPF